MAWARPLPCPRAPASREERCDCGGAREAHGATQRTTSQLTNANGQVERQMSRSHHPVEKAMALIPVRDARQSYPPFDAIFSPFKHGSIRYGRTASAADRAVLVQLRRFLAVIHTICTLPCGRCPCSTSRSGGSRPRRSILAAAGRAAHRASDALGPELQDARREVARALDLMRQRGQGPPSEPLSGDFPSLSDL